MSMRSSSRFGMLTSVLLFTVYSISLSILGPSLPKISPELQLSPLEIGAIISAVHIGFALVSFPAGIASDRIDRRKVFSFGLTLVAVGAFSIGWSTTSLMLFLSALALGSGGGMFEAGINPFVSELFPGKEGFAINFLHVFWGVGSFIGPLTVIILLNVYNAWSSSFFLVSIVAAFAASFSFLPKSKRSTNIDQASDFSSKQTSINYTEFLSVIIAAFMMWGVEISILNWLPLFLTAERGLGTSIAAVALALFQLFLAVGRILWGPISDRLGLARTMRMGAIGGGLLLSVAVLAREQLLIFLSLSTSAFFFASVIPILIAMGSLKSPSTKGTGSGVVLSSGSFGAMVTPFVIGFVAQHTSIFQGFIIVCVIALLIGAIPMKSARARS